MTTDKTSSKSSAIRSLLIKAWRERWTGSQYGTHIKGILGRVSGDVYGLADSLVQLALNGPAPNQLLISLLNHSLATQLVSYSATLVAVSKFSSYSRPHCTKALIDLVLEHRKYITCRGRGEECVELSTSLLALATWILTVYSQTILRMVELRESKTDLYNLEKGVELLEWLTGDKFAASLLSLGRQEDQDHHQLFLAALKGCGKSSEQMYTFLEEDDPSLQARLMAVLQSMKTLDPSTSLLQDERQSTSLVYTLHSLLAYDVLLQPTSDLSQLAGQLQVIMSIRKVNFATMVCEITRCCLLAMNEHDGMEVLRWDAFTLIKLYKLVERMRGGETGRPGEVFRGLCSLLEYSALLDMTDAKCKANTFELVVRTFSTENKAFTTPAAALLSDSEHQQLIAARNKQLEARKALDLKPPAESRDVTLIVKADSTLDTIIQTFENRTTEQMLKLTAALLPRDETKLVQQTAGSSFDLLLSAAAANGTLKALVSKLLVFNEGCKESMGESVRVSQNRAALFDMTFLMLVYMVQCFGSSIVLTDGSSGFFSSWARQCMVEPGWVKPLSGFTEQESQVDGLLQQILTGDIRTQVIKWNNVCSSIHGVMREILLGCEMGAVTKEQYHRLTSQLSSKLCCFPICIVSWLASNAQFGDESFQGGGTRPKASSVVDIFIQISGEAEETEGLPYYPQRSTMMVNIIKKMRKEFEESSNAKRKTATESLSAELDSVWEELRSRGRPDISTTREFARLFDIGGPEWFTEVLIQKMTAQVYSGEVNRCTELVFSLLHIDLAACTLALLLHILPRLLAGEGCESKLSYPAGKSLARLTVSCLAAALNMKSSTSYSRKRKFRASELEDLCNSHRQAVKLRKLVSSDSVSVDHVHTQEQLLDQAHTGLFQLLSGLGNEPVISPKLEFVCSILAECVKVGRDESVPLLAPLNSNLVTQLIKLQPERFTMELILRLFDTGSSLGRKHCARLLCLLNNIHNSRSLTTSEQ